MYCVQKSEKALKNQGNNFLSELLFLGKLRLKFVEISILISKVDVEGNA